MLTFWQWLFGGDDTFDPEARIVPDESTVAILDRQARRD